MCLITLIHTKGACIGEIPNGLCPDSEIKAKNQKAFSAEVNIYISQASFVNSPEREDIARYLFQFFLFSLQEKDFVYLKKPCE